MCLSVLFHQSHFGKTLVARRETLMNQGKALVTQATKKDQRPGRWGGALCSLQGLELKGP